MSIIHFAFKYLKVQPNNYFGTDLVTIVRSKLIENIRPTGLTIDQRIEMAILASYVQTHCSNTDFVENHT